MRAGSEVMQHGRAGVVYSGVGPRICSRIHCMGVDQWGKGGTNLPKFGVGDAAANYPPSHFVMFQNSKHQIAQRISIKVQKGTSCGFQNTFPAAALLAGKAHDVPPDP